MPGLKTFVNERWLKINTDLQSLPYTCSTIGINPVRTSSLIVYPNPTRNIFYLNGGKVGAKFTIVNVFEQTELSGGINSSNNFAIDITNLNTGLYFLIISESNGKVTVHKIIKE